MAKDKKRRKAIDMDTKVLVSKVRLSQSSFQHWKTTNNLSQKDCGNLR